MAERTRSGADLIDDALKGADNEGADSAGGRYPRPEVLRYCNQGGAELWDLLIEARGPDYFRAVPQVITTTANTTSYPLNADFYMLISVRRDGDGNGIGEPLVSFSSQEEPFLRDTTLSGVGWPTHYQLRRTPANVNSLAVLPAHQAGMTLTVDYVPVYIDITDSASSPFHGISGWEEYVVDYAALKMARKDQEWALCAELKESLKMMRARILKLAPKRDMHRAKRVKDVRGSRRWW